MKVVILFAATSILVSCDKTPPNIQEARDNLQKTRQEAAKQIADAERELSEAIRRSERTIENARRDLNDNPTTLPESEQGSSTSATTLPPDQNK